MRSLKKTVFSSTEPDTTFLDKPDPEKLPQKTEERKEANKTIETPEAKIEREAKEVLETKAAADGIITDPLHPEYDANADPTNTGGDKNKVVDLLLLQQFLKVNRQRYYITI